MKVILQEDVLGLGEEGDVCETPSEADAPARPPTPPIPGASAR